MHSYFWPTTSGHILGLPQDCLYKVPVLERSRPQHHSSTCRQLGRCRVGVFAPASSPNIDPVVFVDPQCFRPSMKLKLLQKLVWVGSVALRFRNDPP